MPLKGKRQGLPNRIRKKGIKGGGGLGLFGGTGVKAGEYAFSGRKSYRNSNTKEKIRQGKKEKKCVAVTRVTHYQWAILPFRGGE